MKKIYAILTMAATLAACAREELPLMDQAPETTLQTYTLSIDAVKNADASKALDLDGHSLSASWAAGERVTVYNVTKSAALDGYLEVQEAGAKSTLEGLLTGTIESGDQLRLTFLDANYSAQNGTLDYIASNCDYAEAMITVASVDGSNHVTPTTDASFTNQQAIVKFILKNAAGTDALSASSLTISASGDKLVTGKGYTSKSITHSGFTHDAGTETWDASQGTIKLVDGDKSNSKWCSNKDERVDGIWYCEFHASSPLRVDGYTLTTGNDNAWYRNRNPKSWVLKAKLSALDSWTTIATVTNDSVLQDEIFRSYDFEVAVPGRYQYFRFEVSENKGADVVQLEELELYEKAYESLFGDLTITPASASSELTVALRNEYDSADSYTLQANVGGEKYFFTKSGISFQHGKYYEVLLKMLRICSSITVLGGQTGIHTDDGQTGMTYLFDGNKNTKWCSYKAEVKPYADRISDDQSGRSDQVIWKTSGSVVLAAYMLTTGFDTAAYPGRNWKSWTIYGANFADDASATMDAAGWTQIQQITNDEVLQGANSADFYFTIPGNSTAYQYYKLVIDDIQDLSDNVHQMAEMMLLVK